MGPLIELSGCVAVLGWNGPYDSQDPKRIASVRLNRTRYQIESGSRICRKSEGILRETMRTVTELSLHFLQDFSPIRRSGRASQNRSGGSFDRSNLEMQDLNREAQNRWHGG